MVRARYTDGLEPEDRHDHAARRHRRAPQADQQADRRQGRRAPAAVLRPAHHPDRRRWLSAAGRRGRVGRLRRPVRRQGLRGLCPHDRGHHPRRRGRPRRRARPLGRDLEGRRRAVRDLSGDLEEGHGPVGDRERAFRDAGLSDGPLPSEYDAELIKPKQGRGLRLRPSMRLWGGKPCSIVVI
ncbi:hypothetical protein CC_1084 [Caulobacter vibrioides CB15]|uniref:Uncharacterized protein n=1 Tax=Caulobacter vibrioides (strain ATCC 19089 / CIP 103742 / CB 15) TaxID=190650 RepID=Q9A9B0_CAUVC|nr:hypothetical protein CC_1084 [Caulobacter vibrioides CB15]